MPDVSIPNYQQPFGSRKINVTQHNGPTAYVQGGETINASTFGWGSFDAVIPSASFNANNTGNYNPVVLHPVGQSANGATGANSVKLKWLFANGTEAANNANLSTEYTRLTMLGG